MGDAPLGWLELFDPARAESDSVVPYLAISQALAARSRTVIDVGCGRGAWANNGDERSFQDLRAPGRTVIGIDVDPAAQANPLMDEVRLIDASGRWPLEDGAVDLVVSDFTLEHVADPAAFVDELYRVLRPGGAVVARSVSRHSPLSIAARAVPNRRHADVLSSLQPDREARDIFPTVYRMNSERHLGALLDGRFQWAVAHRTGLERYFLPWPRMSRAVAVVEHRLPRAARSIFVLTARKV